MFQGFIQEGAEKAPSISINNGAAQAPGQPQVALNKRHWCRPQMPEQRITFRSGASLGWNHGWKG